MITYILFLLPALCGFSTSFAAASSTETISVETVSETVSNNPNMFWNPIAYWQKAFTDPIKRELLPATQINLEQAGENIGADLSKRITDEVLPQAELRARSTLRSLVMACFWLMPAYFGAKLAYENIKKHDGTLKCKETAKAACGIAIVMLAVWGINNSF
jgi:hypothetical protein